MLVLLTFGAEVTKCDLMLKWTINFALLLKYLPTNMHHVSIVLGWGIDFALFYLLSSGILSAQSFASCIYASCPSSLNWRIDFTFLSSGLLNSQFWGVSLFLASILTDGAKRTNGSSIWRMNSNQLVDVTTKISGIRSTRRTETQTLITNLWCPSLRK